VNHQNRLVLDPSSVNELFPGHQYGRKFEIYQLKDPDAVSKDHPSYHPKVEVLVNQKMNGGDAWAWADRQDVVEEIDETLLNFLNWDDIPLAPDASAVYVADDHFEAVPRDDPVELYPDPTPRLEANSEHLLLTTLDDLGETPRAVAGSVATDGGADIQDLADELGRHPSTIYRAIQKMGEILDLEDGQVSYRARKYREEIRALVESAEYGIESYADRLHHMMGLADVIGDCSPFQQWLAEHGAELEFGEDGEPKRLRVDTILSTLKSSSFESAHELAHEAIEKWRHSGNDPTVFSQIPMLWQTPDGSTEGKPVGTLAPDW